jgi:CheY-like chemotaxis protein
MSDVSAQKKILIIEDEAVFRMTLGALLRSRHFLVLEAANGLDGLAGVAMFQPDVVLCDLQMPGMTGHEVIECIHYKYPRIPVIVISGVAKFEDVTQALREGASDYLIKPIGDWNVVIDAIQQCLINTELGAEYTELQLQRISLRKDDVTATRMMQMLQKSSPVHMGEWRVVFHSSNSLMYCDIYQTPSALLVLVIELAAEMMDVAFIAAMIKFLLESPYQQYLKHENHLFDSPSELLGYLNWHIYQSGILCNINCSIFSMSRQHERLLFSNAGFSSPSWLNNCANLSLGLLPNTDYHNYEKDIVYPFAVTLHGDNGHEMQVEVYRE